MICQHFRFNIRVRIDTPVLELELTLNITLIGSILPDVDSLAYSGVHSAELLKYTLFSGMI